MELLRTTNQVGNTTYNKTKNKNSISEPCNCYTVTFLNAGSQNFKIPTKKPTTAVNPLSGPHLRMQRMQTQNNKNTKWKIAFTYCSLIYS